MPVDRTAWILTPEEVALMRRSASARIPGEESVTRQVKVGGGVDRNGVLTKEHVMRVQFTMPPVVRACVALAGLLLVSGLRLLAASEQGDDAKAAARAKGQNGTKKVQGIVATVRPEVAATRNNGTGPAS